MPLNMQAADDWRQPPLADGDEVMLYVADETNHVASVKLRLHGTGDGAGGAGGSDGTGATAGTNSGGSDMAGGGASVGGGAGESEDGPAEMEAGAPAADAANGASANEDEDEDEDGGCGCRVQQAHRDHAALLLAVLGLGLLWRRRSAFARQRGVVDGGEPYLGCGGPVRSERIHVGSRRAWSDFGRRVGGGGGG